MNDVCPNVTNGARMDTIVRVKAAKTGRTGEAVYADFAAQTALGRFVDEADVAAAIRFLVSDQARNITGHDLPVDAGGDVRRAAAPSSGKRRAAPWLAAGTGLAAGS